MKTIFFYLVFILFFCFFACGKKEIIIYNDITLLKNTINLTEINPISVKWTMTELGNNRSLTPSPKDFNLIAILTLSESEWLNLKEKYSKDKEINNKIYLKNDFIKSWFNTPVKQSFYLEEEYYRISCTSYSAKTFLKSPFVDGLCFFANENQVFIMLYTI